MRRVRTGELVAGASGAVLLVSMFLAWYEPRAQEASLSAWGAFSVLDLVLALVGLLGVALLVLQVVGRGPALPVAAAVLTTTLALATTLLVLYRILNQPGPNEALDVSPGAYLGLLAAAGVFLGAWRSLSDERPRPVDPPAPAPQRRPTPT